MYTTRITLQYPNGRIHEETLTTCQPLFVGSAIELYGRTWTVVHETMPRSRYDSTLPSLVCEQDDMGVAAIAA